MAFMMLNWECCLCDVDCPDKHDEDISKLNTGCWKEAAEGDSGYPKVVSVRYSYSNSDFFAHDYF